MQAAQTQTEHVSCHCEPEAEATTGARPFATAAAKERRQHAPAGPAQNFRTAGVYIASAAKRCKQPAGDMDSWAGDEQANPQLPADLVNIMSKYTGKQSHLEEHA
jgi:hypothetical protein